MANCKSFEANIDNDSKILILGSMPGVKSLNEKQYYAHPQNRFYPLMAKICNCKNLEKLSYEKRLQVLLNNKIALWDVIKSCKREGSLDLNIKQEKPNDIINLLKQFKNIRIICLNGNKAYSAFKKYFPKLLEEYNCYKLPSTSPANAKYNLDDLYLNWKNAIDFS